MSKDKKLNIKELKKQLEKGDKIQQEYLKGWQREKADFLNYKKQEMERLEKILKHAGESFIIEMLPILDNFEIIEKNLPDKLKQDKNIQGILQIRKQFQDFLKSKGLEQIESLGQKFNPEFHEVAEQIETKNKKPGIIIEEIQGGYKLNGKVIRPAKVKVNK